METQTATTPRTRGQPLKFQSLPDLEAKIQEYFDFCDSRTKDFATKEGQIVQVRAPRPYTVTGLAMFLGTSREGLLNYEKEEGYELFFDTIRRAKLRIHNHAEESLWEPKIAPGIIFNLCNNWGWKQKTEVEHTGPGGGPILVAPAVSGYLETLFPEPQPTAIDAEFTALPAPEADSDPE